MGAFIVIQYHCLFHKEECHKIHVPTVVRPVSLIGDLKTGLILKGSQLINRRVAHLLSRSDAFDVGAIKLQYLMMIHLFHNVSGWSCMRCFHDDNVVTWSVYVSNNPFFDYGMHTVNFHLRVANDKVLLGNFHAILLSQSNVTITKSYVSILV